MLREVKSRSHILREFCSSDNLKVPAAIRNIDLEEFHKGTGQDWESGESKEDARYGKLSSIILYEERAAI